MCEGVGRANESVVDNEQMCLINVESMKEDKIHIETAL